MRILWIPHTGWHIPQRAHLFCHALAESHEVHVTDLWADFSGWRDYFSMRYLRNFSYRRYQDGKITVHGVPRISPAIFSRRLRQINNHLFSTLVSRLIAQYRIDVVVGTFVVPPPQAPRLIFDLFDENVGYWQSYSKSGRARTYAQDIAMIEAAYLQQADVVVTVNSILTTKARRDRPHGKIIEIPNGIDIAPFNHGGGASIRARLGLKGTIIGMLGNHDKPQELNKVIAAAKYFDPAQFTFFIIGRGKALPDAISFVEQHNLTNIVFHGFVAMSEAPQYIDALDIGICPYLKTPGADASSPMRLFAYAAAGIPTVCTDLDSVRDLGWDNVILVKDSPEALAEGIKHALQLPRRQPCGIKNYDLPYLVRRYEQVLQDAPAEHDHSL